LLAVIGAELTAGGAVTLDRRFCRGHGRRGWRL